MPEYQRPFKWKREQIEQIIQDMKESMDTGEYFIGSEGFQQILTLAYIKYEFYYYVNYIASPLETYFPLKYQGDVIKTTKDFLY